MSMVCLTDWFGNAEEKVRAPSTEVFNETRVTVSFFHEINPAMEPFTDKKQAGRD